MRNNIYYNKITFSTICALIALCTSSICWSTTYYVDATGGKDSNSGTATNNAWKTISKINTSSFTAGDSILFKKGETWREQLMVPSSGDSIAQITFGEYGSGAAPVISGADIVTAWTVPPVGAPNNVYQASVAWTPAVVMNNGTKLLHVASLGSIIAAGEWFYDTGSTILYVRTTGSDSASNYTMEVGRRDYCINVNGRSYNTVSDLSCNGANSSGIILQGGANYNTISNNTITNITSITGSGIWARGILVDGGTNNTISGNSISYAWGGITVEGWGTPLPKNNTIIRNTVHDVDSVGIGATSGSTGAPINTIIDNNTIYNCVLTVDDNPGIGTYHVGVGTIIRRNVVHNCGSASARGSGINIDSGSAATQAYYNLVYLNNYGGINLTASGHSVYNNTLYHNNEGSADAGEISIFTMEGVHGSSMTIKNNILSASSGKHVLMSGSGNTTGHTINNNIFYGGTVTSFNWGGTDYNFTNYKTRSSQDANSLNADPLFVSTMTPDFRLLSSSPAINAGVDVGLTSDYAGNKVPMGSAVDIGAYEYQGGSIINPFQKFPQSPTNIIVN